MPHLRIEYTANLARHADIDAFCQAMARAIVEMRDPAGQPVFPLLGTRVLAFPAAHYAVADGDPQRGFVYLNLRVTPGRSDAQTQAAGAALLAAAQLFLAEAMTRMPLRLTLHIDPIAPAYEGKLASPA